MRHTAIVDWQHLIMISDPAQLADVYAIPLLSNMDKKKYLMEATPSISATHSDNRTLKDRKKARRAWKRRVTNAGLEKIRICMRDVRSISPIFYLYVWCQTLCAAPYRDEILEQDVYRATSTDKIVPLTSLCDQKVYIPERQAIASKILSNCYTDIKSQVQRFLTRGLSMTPL